MDPITISALIAAGSAVAGAGANVIGGINSSNTQRDINAMNLEEARRILMMQRQWALFDWDKVNSYNSPLQQMQRYKEAGLNPQLIYGNVNNSPAAMIRNTTQGAYAQDPTGIIAGNNQVARGIATGASDMVNNYFAAKQLENDTNLKQAQILNLKSQSDKTQLDNELTRKNFNELAIKAAVDNDYKRTQTAVQGQIGSNMPTPEMARRRYGAETERIESLLNLANQQGLLNQYDIDMIEKLSGLKDGPKMISEFLKIILSAGLKRALK